MRHNIFIFVLLFVIITHPAFSRTWFIEKNGSGDFTSLQPAADAATSGDTLRIGRGRFDDIVPNPCSNFSPNPLRLVIQLSRLTIIGSEIGETIIGPEEIQPNWQAGIKVDGDCGNKDLYIRNIKFENLGDCITAMKGEKIIIESCVFFNCRRGLSSNRNEISISNCVINSNDFQSQAFNLTTGWRVDSFEVRDCEFNTPEAYLAQINGGPDGTFKVSDCTFTGSGSGVIYAGNGGLVENCHFSGIQTGIFINTGIMTIKNSTFTNLNYGIRHIDWFGNGRLNILNCQFSNIGDTCLRTYGLKYGFLQNSILDKGAQYVVQVNRPYYEKDLLKPEPEMFLNFENDELFYSASVFNSMENAMVKLPTEEYHFDMTDNWWGTIDPDTIQAWIFDGDDLEDWPVFIDWDPFKTEPVSQESNSFGGLKSMFR